MLRSVVLALALVATGTSAVMAQIAPTAAEKAACRSDAMKLCPADIGKPAQMQACLRDNKEKLSEACLRVVEAHGG